MAFPESAVLPQAKARRPARPDPEGPDRTRRPAQQARSGRAGRAGFGMLPGGEGPMPCACVKLRGQAGFAVFPAPGLPGLPVALSPVPLSLLVLVRPCPSLLAWRARQRGKNAAQGKGFQSASCSPLCFPGPAQPPCRMHNALLSGARVSRGVRAGAKARPSGRRQGKPGPEGRIPADRFFYKSKSGD